MHFAGSLRISWHHHVWGFDARAIPTWRPSTGGCGWHRHGVLSVVSEAESLAALHHPYEGWGGLGPSTTGLMGNSLASCPDLAWSTSHGSGP